MSLTTHILDTAKGKPAPGIEVIAYRRQGEEWLEFVRGTTDKNGRITNWLDGQEVATGIYKLVFKTGDYFEDAFYPVVEVTFTIVDDTHYHIPLLLSPYGYSTYRGS
jgi:5-hydroxyisourate hydrolase